MNFDSTPDNALNRSLEDPRTPELASGAAALYTSLATYLARVGGYNEALNPLARQLAQRIGEADARAPMEF
ncbi:hypothetical protein NHG97_16100 [Pseudomonas corrugata]|uniref:hypothetical protein n=1 Tax=Pseudomonas corrugata TaxID=47879 RepID=UPI0028C40C3D|nr:hypothetical protein [Pseudomonas corrugata]MDU9040220.1 hypothetical protein [Pseudomonas corrugata]